MFNPTQIYIVVVFCSLWAWTSLIKNTVFVCNFTLEQNAWAHQFYRKNRTSSRNQSSFICWQPRVLIIAAQQAGERLQSVVRLSWTQSRQHQASSLGGHQLLADVKRQQQHGEHDAPQREPQHPAVDGVRSQPGRSAVFVHKPFCQLVHFQRNRQRPRLDTWWDFVSENKALFVKNVVI